MLFIFMGQSCTGKSTAAEKMKELVNVEVFSGRDFLRMAKNENEAWKLFYEKLTKAALNRKPEESVVYIITEIEHLKKIKSINGLFTVKFTASLEVIKSRFALRMRGKLPPPIEIKLENQFTEWKNEVADMMVDTTEDICPEKLIEELYELPFM